MPKVSILIPCYNCEKWIRESIQSALSQSLVDKEVIVIDDGSTDGSQDIISSFGDKIQYIIDAHSGANAVRNKLLGLSKGEWVQYLDADDYMLPNKIQDQLNYLKECNSADVLYSPVIVEDLSCSESRKYIIKIPGGQNHLINFARWGSFQTSGMLWKKEAIVSAGGWKETQQVCQEHELILRLIMRKISFVLFNKANSVYRLHKEESVSRMNKPDTIIERMNITKQFEDFLLSNLLLDKYIQYAINLSRFECARGIYYANRSLAGEYMNKIFGSDPNFHPSGEAAPFLYRVIFNTFGFEKTEEIALFFRNIRKKRGV